MTNITDSLTFDAHTETMTKNHPTDARFCQRVYVSLADSIIISLLSLPIVIFSIIFFNDSQVLNNFFGQTSQKIVESSDEINVVLIYIVYLISAVFISTIYSCYYLSSNAQATPGMKLHNLKLVNSQGNRPSFIQVFLRELISIISFTALCLGYLMILFTKRRQALHDMVTSTYVQDHSDESKTEILISQHYQNFIYGGFWRRVGAAIIDAIIFMTFCLLLAILLYFDYKNKNPLTELGRFRIIILGFILYFVPMFYKIIFTSSKFQATPGKMLFSLKVVDSTGNRLTTFRSFIRCFSEIFYSSTLIIGYLIVAFTKRKQGLHDKIARTYVIRVLKKSKDSHA
ncbi:MAG: RDD family protein [Janthinobacterium lividum]